MHAEGDDITWFREIDTCKVTGPDGYQYEPVWINPCDAERLGIADGDIVRLFNECGSVLGGANNLICPSATTSKNAPGEVTNGFLVGIEKVDVLELAKQYPDQFARPFDPEEGAVASSRIVKS